MAVDGSLPHDPEEQVRLEASAWFARMRAEDAERSRPEFLAWLARDPRHKAVYERLLTHFERSSSGEPDRVGSGTASSRTRMLMLLPLAAALAGLVWSVSAIVRQPGVTPLAPATEASNIQLVAGPQTTPRATRLADGSVVTLDADTRLDVALSQHARRLALLRGRARFSVAHDISRPFIVSAGGISVIAHGTIFDVALSADQAVDVHMIEGGVAIARSPHVAGGSGRMPALAASRVGQGRLTRPGAATNVILSGHQHIVLTADASAGPITSDPVERWPQGLIDVDHAPLRVVLEEANRHSQLRIVASRSVEAREVSGSFSTRDPDQLADLLARSLGLTAERSHPGVIVLSDKMRS